MSPSVDSELAVLVIGIGEPASVVHAELSQRGHHTVGPKPFQKAIPELGHDDPDLIVLCIEPQRGAVQQLTSVLSEAPGSQVIVVGEVESERRHELFNVGAFEHVPAYNDVRGLLAATGLAVGARREDRELRYRRRVDSEHAKLDVLVGDAKPMREVFERVRQFCARTAGKAVPRILLLGETGTGKGALAKCIHYNSSRRNMPFVEVNCAAIPPTLIEAELFGYERGAFTGARQRKEGLFETADGGTLFLDEIASLPLDLQPKLLTVIEEMRLRRVGGRSQIHVDVQVVGASHMTLKAMVRDGSFREDLYHRLNVLSIHLPPLRERGEDVIRLADFFLSTFCTTYGVPLKQLSEGAQDYLRACRWPGNIRELRNQIERIVLLHDDACIEDWHFDRPSTPPMLVPDEAAKPGFDLRLPDEGLSLEDLEQEVIRKALERCDGNVSRTARFLSLSRQTLIYRLKKHGIR